MKTLLPNKDFFIIDNEFYQVEKRLPTKYWIYKCNIKDEVEGSFEKNVLGDSWFEKLHDKQNYFDVVATTNTSLQGVKQLDRSLFVKGVDVEELANENCPENYIDASYEDCFKYGFERGHNANKNEWTDQEFKLAISKAIDFGKQGKSAPESIKILKSMLRPLSLPSSIIISGEEIKQINW